MPRRRIGLVVGVLVLAGLSVVFEDRFWGTADPATEPPVAADPFASPAPSPRQAARARRDERNRAA
ncbi:MAG: hypothetical protein AAF447_28535, partial [Myxococcota bacterium]